MLVKVLLVEHLIRVQTEAEAEAAQVIQAVIQLVLDCRVLVVLV
jgi:hypothetical protein